jgi:hypothetical protein
MRGKAIRYTEAEMAWLETNRLMVISDYHTAFVATFMRDDVTAAHLHSLRKRKGWKVGRDGGRYKGRRLKYSDAEIAWLREHCALPIADYHAGFQAAFGRTDTSAAKLRSLRKREGFKTGRDGRFVPGQASPTKGQKRGPAHPNSRATLFKLGHDPANRHPMGHERMTDDGYLEIKVAQTNPYTGHNTRYVHKHRHLWEQANGPLPPGMVLKCLDGDKTNTDPANWEAVPRGLLPRLNGKSGRNYDTADPAVKPTIMAIAKLEHKARELKKAEEGK